MVPSPREIGMGSPRAQTPPADLCDLSTMVKLGQKLKRVCQALSEVLGLTTLSVASFSISRRGTRHSRCDVALGYRHILCDRLLRTIRRAMQCSLAWPSRAEEWFYP